MIITVKKYIFIGVKEDLDLFYERAQKKGFIEFISPTGRKARDYPENLQKLMEALKILRKQPHAKQASLVKDLDPFKLAFTVVEAKKWKEKLEEDARLMQAEIARISPLGEFSLEEIREIEQEGSRHVQFFCVKRSKAKKMTVPDDLIHIRNEYDMDYYMSVSDKVMSFPSMIEMHIEKSFSQLNGELEATLISIKNCQKELSENAAYIDFLKDHLVLGFNAYHLEFSKKEIQSHMNDALFAIEAWIPENRLHGLFPLLEGLGIHAEEISIEKDELVPTYMENSGFGKVGEDLVHIYDTPATDDKDPSTWVFWSFAIFFAMIISDAGYGAIFLAVALILRKKFKQAAAGVKRFLRLFTVLSIFAIIWGILAGSYFGLYIAPENPINKVSIIHDLAVKKADYHIKHKDAVYEEIIDEYPALKDVKSGDEFLQKGIQEDLAGRTKYAVYDEFRDSIFMELALLVGVIHVCLSLFKRVPRHFAGAGWILAVIGGYLYFPSVLDAVSIVHFVDIIPREMAFKIGLQLMCVGGGGALLLALIQNRLGGLLEIAKVIELFADVLSYLRLYALGLAAMILAETFNGMGERVGFVGGFFIILVGHTINITVGIMGGTIHGLRLNFIEWYHHCFTGGGKMFNPLKLLKVRGE